MSIRNRFSRVRVLPLKAELITKFTGKEDNKASNLMEEIALVMPIGMLRKDSILAMHITT